MNSVAKTLLMSTSLCLATSAWAQGTGDAVEQVTVTGSRIVSSGFEAPTPVTAISAERLMERAPSNIPDALNQLPIFRGSTSNSASTTWNTNSPNQGNYLNLRNLGFTRSLVLLDGVRVPATSFNGAVDVNSLPQALVQRVDVVTGGASAAYGSDAVVGVVNFVLDKKFEGLKASIQGGIASRGDDASWKATLVGGTSFAGGRGHIEGTFDHYFSDGIHNINKRKNGGNQVTNVGGRTQASPGVTYWNARFSKASTGGTIFNAGGSPLNFYQFQPDGTVRPEDLGQPTVGGADYQVGGSGGYFGGSSLTSRLRTEQIFGRVSYDLTDTINVHLQVNASEANNRFYDRYDDRFAGTSNGITIFRDNAYLQPSVLAAIGSAQSFNMGRLGNDMPRNQAKVITNSGMVNIGVDGTFPLFGNDWRWDMNATYGEALLRVHVNENNNQRFYAAIDAVKDSTGKIVCRVTLANPSLLPGCVPMNVMGEGAPSAAAIAYTQGDSSYRVNNSTGIISGNFSGALFELPAGPLSVAMGAETRRQTLLQRSNSDPALASAVNYTGIKGVPSGVTISNFTNIGAAKGAANVNEGYLEFAVPVVKDLPLVQSFELNGAARYTEYSTSGSVTTWKLGGIWQVFDDLRLRTTFSRDIAAPTLYQLFAGTQVATANRPDLHTGATNVNLVEQTGGNPLLTPEKAATIVAGFVYTPGWLPGFTTSVDYYHIRIQDAIGTTNTVQQIQDCELSNGTSPICGFIIRPLPFSDRTINNIPLRSILVAQNQAAIIAEGVDIETAYRFSVADIIADWEGDMELHSYLSLTTAYTTKASANAAFITTNGTGVNSKVRVSLEAVYDNGPLSTRLGLRDTGGTQRSFSSFYAAPYNMESDAWYTDLTVSYRLDDVAAMRWAGGDDLKKQVFITVQNLFDTKPPIVSDCCNPGLQYPTDRVKYDVIGAYFTVGLRVTY
jgi:iron complex outermembrane receptor protein